MDQASIHTSDKILEKLARYFGCQLTRQSIGKFIKYEWIEIDAYENWDSFLKYLKKVLDNFGEEYVINFV